MSIETITLNFDSKLTQFLVEFYQVQGLIKKLSEDEDMPDEERAFYLENTLHHMAYLRQVMSQVFKERTII